MNTPTQAARKRPRNVLLFLVDDLNLALGAYGHPAAFTPNIDRLASKGLQFENAFTPYPLCGPARSALMTGQRPENLRMPNNEVCWRETRPGLRSLPEIARAQGWTTAGIGKIFHHGLPAADLAAWQARHPGRRNAHTYQDPPSWDSSFTDFPRSFEEKARGPEQLIDGNPHGGTALYNLRATNPEVLPDKIFADKAVEFLQNTTASPRQPDTPFLLAVGFMKPHVPFIAPEKWWGYYDSLDVEALVPPTWFQPAAVPSGTLKRSRFHRGADEEQRRHLYKGYLACVSWMDEQLGRVLNALEATNQAEDTLIVFTADHGYHIGEQGQWDKMMPLDPALRVPLILSGPGIPGGKKCAAQVETLDLFPTLCSLLDLEAKQAADGHDLRPLIQNPDQTSDRKTYAWLNEGKREAWTVRTPTHRFGLVSNPQGATEPFLFDYTVDPDESRNLAGDLQHAALQRSLETALRAFYAKSRPIPA